MKISRREALKQIGLFAGVIWLPACSISTKETPLTPPAGDLYRPKKNKTIALLGATGMVGGYILNKALIQGYEVRALVRTPAKLDAFKNQITIIQGDARDVASIQELLTGCDVVISALGPVKAEGKAAVDICSAATSQILEVMRQQNLNRYIVISGAAVTMPGDHRNLKGWMIQKLAQIALSEILRDKNREFNLLQASWVQWTLVRCPLIDPEPYRHAAQARLDTPASFNLRAGELARFVIDQIDSLEYIRKGPFLGSV